MPHAVWYAPSVQVNSGFNIENLGRMISPLADHFNKFSSFVITDPLEPSLPAAEIVSTVPTGSASLISFPLP